LNAQTIKPTIKQHKTAASWHTVHRSMKSSPT
jgi:hypothetical protein